LQLFPFLQLFTTTFIKYGAKCKCDLKNILLTISVQFHCLWFA